MSDNKFARVTREQLDKKTIEELQEILGVNEAEFKAVAAAMSVEELDAYEQELMDVFRENDERMKGVVYELTTDPVEFENQTVKVSDCQRAIVSFLNRIETEFRATLGVYQAIRFWKTIQDNKVPYAHYDSTLRMLGTLKFKGEKDFFDILAINNYMSSCRENYLADVAYIGYLSDIHQTIMEARGDQEKDGIEEGLAEEGQA